MKIAGIDIGGANTDLAVVEFTSSGGIKNIRADDQYLPMWTDKDRLGEVVIALLGLDYDNIDALAVSMTAELVDAYSTKREGVVDIANKVMEVVDVPVGFIGQRGIMEYSDVLTSPMEVAAANWIATSPLAAMVAPNSIMVDTGSTTTDIIPIKDSMECAMGRTDLDRLATGELVYTGLLRTNVATLVDRLPLRDYWVRVASELFAITADVHLILGNIIEKDYTCSTPDAMGKSAEDSMQRIARVVCADLELLDMEEVEDMALFIYQNQVSHVAEAILEVSKRNQIEHIVPTGLGMDIVGKQAAKVLGLEYTGMDHILTKDECKVAPAIGTSLMMETYISD
jgi:probable H4MPT-linked C1 transfer pathway protein